MLRKAADAAAPNLNKMFPEGSKRKTPEAKIGIKNNDGCRSIEATILNGLEKETDWNTRNLRARDPKTPMEVAFSWTLAASYMLETRKSNIIKTDIIAFETRERNDVLLKSKMRSPCSRKRQVTMLPMKVAMRKAAPSSSPMGKLWGEGK